MKKDSIVQFVGFTTALGFDDFIGKWERYAKRLINGKAGVILQQQAETKSRFNYVSQHEWANQDFQFSFMNEKKSEHFPEHNVKVQHLGGYVAIQVEYDHKKNTSDTKLIAFISHQEYDLDFYRALPYHHLNIYQAYYESCTYGYIMEFYVKEQDAPQLSEQLKKRIGIEAGTYAECAIESLHA